MERGSYLKIPPIFLLYYVIINLYTGDLYLRGDNKGY